MMDLAVDLALWCRADPGRGEAMMPIDVAAAAGFALAIDGLFGAAAGS